ncbi:c-type cytochrome biogenesis protein CcmI [Lacimicrobium sp. SS2-24]|uniref:c-type cytochrome biogenesis protein CcmI n=1 Tax=Lacimicrobium sp. SS2-24 TaxID=2005569 RepID=UPI000B4AF10F|nr:c-type cytochrome biogenesis protein CcmI [Lacimicrobium sp. SS2-24]
MIVFWGVACAFFLFALVLIAWPWLFSRQKENGADSQALNVQLTRERLSELQREADEGLISREDQRQAELELKLALAQEQGAVTLTGKRFSLPVVVTGLLVALLVAAGSYWKANEIGALMHWQEANSRLAELGKRVVVEADPSISAEELQTFALALRTRLWHQPEAPEGWLLLGRLHASLNRFDSAIEAYEKSLQLDPQRASARMSLAQALVMTAQENNLRRALALLNELIATEPDNHSAIGLRAIAATQLGDNQKALDSWRQLQQQLPVSDPMYASVQERIAELSGPDNDDATSLTVEVSITPALKEKLPAQGYLIVFARDPQRGNMPAAVIRQPLTDLPVSLTLSDDNAMLADYRLSDLHQAELIARISEDADVSAMAGELEGHIQVSLASGTQMLEKIVINKEIE